jgi:hypothetical protein
MPYIDETRRKDIDSLLDSVLDSLFSKPIQIGDLTYVLYRFLLRYLMTGDVRYQRVAEVSGAIELLKLWFVHDIVIPYEEDKRFQNGPLVEELKVSGIH